MADTHIIKTVILGDAQVGKTFLLMSFAFNNRKSSVPYSPTTFDTFTKIIEKGGKKYTFELSDTGGEDGEEERLSRRLSYQGVDVFMIAFNIKSRKSFENVFQVWINEVKDYNREKKPVCLIGLETDEGERKIKYHDGNLKSMSSGCKLYFECNPLTGEKVLDLFHAIIDVHKLSKNYVSIRPMFSCMSERSLSIDFEASEKVFWSRGSKKDISKAFITKINNASIYPVSLVTN